MSRNLCIILAVSLTLVGCDMAKTQEVQYDDARNPFYKQAQQDLDNNNPAAAANDYEEALGANPKLVGAHYLVGHVYGDKLNDPIGAIYHFQLYLKLAPAGDKTDEVKALIDKEGQAFAASLPNSPTQSADDYAKLQADNATLKKQVDDAARTIAQLQAQLGKHHHDTATADAAAPAAPPAAPVVADNTAAGAAAAAPTPATPSGPQRALPLDSTNVIAGATPATPEAGSGRTYTVVKGDSLWKIASKMYPHDTKNGVDKLQEANKDAIGNKPLKIGQVLIVP